MRASMNEFSAVKLLLSMCNPARLYCTQIFLLGFALVHTFSEIAFVVSRPVVRSKTLLFFNLIAEG